MRLKPGENLIAFYVPSADTVEDNLPEADRPGRRRRRGEVVAEVGLEYILSTARKVEAYNLV